MFPCFLSLQIFTLPISILQLAERVAKLANKTHKDRVSEFNAHLESLSEHHDIPKVIGCVPRQLTSYLTRHHRRLDQDNTCPCTSSLSSLGAFHLKLGFYSFAMLQWHQSFHLAAKAVRDEVILPDLDITTCCIVIYLFHMEIRLWQFYNLKLTSTNSANTSSRFLRQACQTHQRATYAPRLMLLIPRTAGKRYMCTRSSANSRTFGERSTDSNHQWSE